MAVSIFEHLLPRSTTWKLTAGKRLRQLFEGLEATATAARQAIDGVHDDIFPATTTELAAWETQLGLRGSPSVLTEAVRRQRIAGVWGAIGSPTQPNLERVLAAAGFSGVYAYDWFEPNSNPAVPRDPTTGDGRVISKKGFFTASDYAPAGHPDMLAGDSRAYAGNLLGVGVIEKTEPIDPAAARHYIYVGGSTFGADAQVPAVRREEFEALVLGTRPAHKGVILFVEYV